MILQIIGSGMKIAALILGNAYLAKWLSYFRLWWDRQVDPALKKATMDQYQKLNAEFEDIVNRRPPPNL